MSEMEKKKFLRLARQIVEEGQPQKLIINDKEADSNKQFSHNEIYVSQYAFAIKDQSISPSIFSTHEVYSPPILFALVEKLAQKKHFDSAMDLLTYNLRTIGEKHRHILMYNIAKLAEKNKQISRSIFHFESLLKEQGNANDYYTFDYLRLLLQTGRTQEAYVISKRHLHSQKPKVDQIYLFTLKKGQKMKNSGKKILEKTTRQKYNSFLISELTSKFHNKKASYLSAYNIALLLKQSQPEEALKIFRQIQFFLKNLSYHNEVLRLVRVNILGILESIIETVEEKNEEKNMFSSIEDKYCPQQMEQDLIESEKKQQKGKKNDFLEGKKLKIKLHYNYDEEQIEDMLQQCAKIYQYLSGLYPENKKISLKCQKMSEEINSRSILRDRAKQNEHRIILNIIETEANNPQPMKLTNSFYLNSQKKDKKGTVEKIIPSFENDDKQTMEQIYNKKRKENDQKLKFLMQKEKQLKKFFNSLKFGKAKTDFSLETSEIIKTNALQIYSPMVSNSHFRSESSKNSEKNKASLYNFKSENFAKFERQFEEKKKKLEIVYKNGELNEIIQNFLSEWLEQSKKNKVSKGNAPTTKSYRAKIDKFIKGLEDQNKCLSQNRFHNKSSNQITRQASSRQFSSIKTSRKGTFRIKKNLGTEGILLGLKNNDKILTELRNQTQKKHVKQGEEDKKQSRKNIKIFQKQLLKGEVLVEEQKLEQAHDYYVSLYKNYKEDNEKEKVLLKIAEIYEMQDLDHEAEKTYAKCTKYNNIEAFFKLGCLQIKIGELEKGIQNLEKANCIERYNSKIQIKLVYAYSLVDETTDRALALANNILKRNPQSLQALLMTSKILSKKNRLRQALDIALAIGQTKQSSSIFYYIGLLYLNDSNVEEAFKFFQKAIEVDPSHTPSLVELATIVSEVNPEEAIKILQKVISYDQNNHLAYARLGKIYESLEGKYDKALQYYKKGLEIERTYEAYIKIGDCLFQMGSIVDAYLNYKEALLLRKTPQVYQRIAQINEKQGQDRKAIDSYCLALKELPRDNSYFSKRKKILLRLGKLSLVGQQYDSAINYLLEAAEMEESLEIFKMLGQACFGKGDYSDSLAYFKKAINQCEEDNLQILENIAMCYDKQEQFLASKEIYEKILAIDPKNIKCLNNMANIYLILGKTNEAFYWFEFMLQQIPANTEKRLRVADIYATIGDWSKVEQHLLICYKQKQNDIRVLERMVNLYKEKREIKQANKFEKRLNLLKQNKSNQNS